MKKIVMVDFDGTISKVDTCVATLNEFAVRDWKYIEEKWISGEMSTQDCSIELFRIMDFNEEKLKNLLKSIEIDDYFHDFIDFCNKKGYKIYIVSDGFDYNINTILNNYGIKNIKCYSNSFYFNGNGKYRLTFPYENRNCGKCGTCKSEVYNKLKSRADKIIYIGDGYSDRCVAPKVDMLFAKNYLAEYCEEEGIPYIGYNNFKDIVDYLKGY